MRERERERNGAQPLRLLRAHHRVVEEERSEKECTREGGGRKREKERKGSLYERNASALVHGTLLLFSRPACVYMRSLTSSFALAQSTHHTRSCVYTRARGPDTLCARARIKQRAGRQASSSTFLARARHGSIMRHHRTECVRAYSTLCQWILSLSLSLALASLRRIRVRAREPALFSRGAVSLALTCAPVLPPPLSSRIYTHTAR